MNRDLKTHITFIRQKKTAYGGAERYLERLNDALIHLGYTTEILHSGLPKWLPSWSGVLLFSQQVCRKKNSSTFYFSLDRITCPDIYRAGDGVHRAFLKTRGFTLNPLHLCYLWLEKRTFRNAKAIIANSEMVKKEIIDFYAIDPEKIKVIYNGVPIPPIPNKLQAKTNLSEIFSFDKGLPVILFVGSGFRRKGVEEFLYTLAKLRRPFISFIVGKEKRMSHYQMLARKLKISDKVIFTGPRADVELFYEASDIFLFPTRYEPFSNVVLEALSYGDIVFTTRQNGASEILDENFVMHRSNDESIVEKIDRLLGDTDYLLEQQTQARRLAENFPIERNVDETIKLLDKIQKNLS
ncbi:glycosyltransferase family 4 protein [Nitratifractor sp.]